MAVAPAPLDDDLNQKLTSESDGETIASLEASMIVGDEDEEEKVDQIERVLGQYMFQEQGMNVEQAFKYHDKNASDGLDEDELKAILKKAKCTFTEREFEILMSRYDLDNSGSITIQEFQMTYRVQRSDLLDFATLKDDQRAACVQIPSTLVFFLVLLVLVSMHDMTPSKFQTESGMSSELLKTTSSGVKFETISSINDYWTWFENVLLEQAFVQEDLEKEQWGFMSRYNKFVGAGVEISQSRSQKVPCAIDQLKDVYGSQCKPYDKLSKETYGLLDCLDTTTIKPGQTTPAGQAAAKCYNPDQFGIDPMQFDADGFVSKDAPANTNRELLQTTFAFTLDYLSPKDVLRNQIKYYKGRNWIDEQTMEIVVNVATYNAEHGIFAQLILSTKFERGGRVVNKWSSESILGDPYGVISHGHVMSWVMALDFVWIVMVSLLLIGEFQEMREGCMDYIGDFWNVLDWLQCLLTIAIECYWFFIVAQGYQLVQQFADSHTPELLNTTSYTSLQLSAAKDAAIARSEVAWNLNNLLRNGVIYRYLTIVNILVLVIRFFKAFNVQPRLAVISKTLTKSVPDLTHFLVIFICLFMTFVMFAHFVFGHIVPNYSTVSAAAYHTFRGFVAAPAVNVPEIIRTNAYDIIPRYWALPMAEVWWVMFMVLLFLVVRSILLAIVLESYKEAKAHSTHATTMWGQGYDMIRDYISGLRGVIRLRDVNDVLKKNLANKERVNMSMIVRCYADNLKKDPKKKNINFEESKQFILGLVKEYFVFAEVRLPAQDKLRALSAFARISELDSNFNDVCGRIDTLEAKFTQIHDLLTELKGRQ